MSAFPYRTTLIAEAVSKDLTRLERVKQELGITSTDTARDALIAAQIQEETAWIVSQCNREFALETLEESWRCAGRSYRSMGALYPTRDPIVRIVKIVEDGTTLYEPDDLIPDADTLNNDDFEVIPGGNGIDCAQILRLDGAADPSYWSASKITVTYKGGRDLLPELPQDLEKLCLYLVLRRYATRDRDMTIKSESIVGVAQFDYWVGGISLPEEHKQTLDKYTRIVV